MNEQAERTARVRKLLYVSSVVIVCLVLLFLWIVFAGQGEQERTRVFFLAILGGCAILSLCLFVARGEIFDDRDGCVRERQIVTVFVTLLCVLQLTFGFAMYAQGQTKLLFDSYTSAGALAKTFSTRYEASPMSPEMLSTELVRLAREHPEIARIDIVVPGLMDHDKHGKILYSSAPAFVGRDSSFDAKNAYRFPLPDGRLLVMRTSLEYNRHLVLQMLVSLATVMVTSLFFAVELALFVLQLVRSSWRGDGELAGGGLAVLRYVRQIAFLFFLASSLSASFVSVLAKSLGSRLWGLDPNVVAGFPQSTETLFTCFSIFATTVVIERKGWKASFLGGLCAFAAGNVLSAWSGTLAAFLVARALVGVGYGLCWMTLRNYALFAVTPEQKTRAFSHLNSGLYAGYCCGSLAGAILAERFGYGPVLLLGSVCAIATALLLSRFKNATYAAPARHTDASEGPASTRPGGRDWVILLLFVFLMILPSCVVEAGYLGYYLPIYTTESGRGVTDVGRANLLYCVAMIYAGPLFSDWIATRFRVEYWNLFYNALLCAGLIALGATAGFAPALLAAGLFGFADSFGFVAQNHYFLNFKAVRWLGEGRSLAYLSFVKKFFAMLGPIGFGVAMSFGIRGGLAIMGVSFGAALALFALVFFVAGREGA